MNGGRLMEKKGISRQRLITGLVVAIWLSITLFILELFGIHGGWPAFLTLMFFTLGGAKMESLKPIFIGGTVGLLAAALLVLGVEALMTVGIGMQVGIFIMVFLIVFLLVVLEDLSHLLFNSYSFAYFTVALVPAQQATIEWLLVLYLGGGLFLGGVIFTLRYLKKSAIKKAQESQEAQEKTA